MSAKDAPPERPTPKPPIYPVEVIEVACRALEVLFKYGPPSPGDLVALEVIEATDCAIRIIRDGLAGHDKAMRGES